jgi:phage-related protein
MPKTQVVFYQESDGDVPVLDWLKALLKSDRKGYAKCVTRIQQLADMGHELRRPAADYLRDDIYELRAKHINVQYRILYFFAKTSLSSPTCSSKPAPPFLALISTARSPANASSKKIPRCTLTPWR